MRTQAWIVVTFVVTVHGLAGAVLESRSGAAVWNQEESNSREGIGCPLKSALIA